jgi:hypothetical protein
MTYDRRHGGPFDRGAADSYYRRAYRPHYYAGSTGQTEKVEQLTKDELAAYEAGWMHNEQIGDFKDYG